MKKTNSIIASFLLILFLNSCGTVAKGLDGGKKNGNEEFLVEKKSPLVLPPSFGELPEPGEPEKNIASSKKDTSDIKDIINQSSSVRTSEKSDNTKNSIEQSIIKKIKEKKTTEIKLDETMEEKNEKPKKKGFFKKLITKSNNPDN
jgi:hypothetical protein